MTVRSEDGRYTFDRTLAWLLGLALFGGGGAGGYFVRPQIDPNYFVSKVELLEAFDQRLGPLQEDISDIKAELGIALNNVSNHETRISKLETKR